MTRFEHTSGNIPDEELTVESKTEARLDQRKAQWALHEASHKRISNYRLIVFIGFALTLAFSFKYDYSAGWSLVPGMAFLVLVFIHGRYLHKAENALRAVQFYLRSLDRMAHRWMGQGATGMAYAPDDHLYAHDLDIFGPSSLFQFINGARTQAGERCLADWLASPASSSEVLERQAAVTELSPNIDFREGMAILGEDVRASLHPEKLAAWAEAESATPRRRLNAYRLIAGGISGYALLSIVLAGWFDYPLGMVLLAVLLIAAFRMVIRGASASLTLHVEGARRELTILALVFDRFAQEPVSCHRLSALKEQLTQGGQPAVIRIQRLESLVTWMDSGRNQLIAPVALLLFWDFQMACLIERWRCQSGRYVRSWLDALGQLESLSSMAQFHYENPAYCFPSIVAERTFAATALGHPLLARDECVCNDVALISNVQVWIVSGSNMSGKSTLLRSIGVNAVLALAGAPVFAQSMALPSFHIGASLRATDDLQSGVSRFYAEIRRLGRIFEVAKSGGQLLFLIDEIFSGTNSKDRRTGAQGLLTALIEGGASGLITTHDLELTKIEDSLPDRVRNVHFEDSFENGQLSFDYKLKAGVVAKSNALELMKSVGIPTG